MQHYQASTKLGVEMRVECLGLLRVLKLDFLRKE